MTLYSDLVKHKIFLQRLASAEKKVIVQSLNNLAEEAKRQIAFGRSSKSELRDIISTLPDKALKNMLNIAVYESNFSAKIFKKHLKESFNLPVISKVEKALLNSNMEVGNVIKKGVKKTRKSLKTAYVQFSNRKADEIARVLKDGYTNQLTKKEIVDKVDELINGLHSAQAQSLANVSVNYSANIGRNELIKENKDVVDKEIWVSVLDENTTEYCEEHDGRIYNIDEGPMPPAHWNCRSERYPYIADQSYE